MKATAQAPANIAFIKYWGKKNEVLRLPENGSLSMNLSGLWTETTVEFLPKYKKDKVVINGEKEVGEEIRVIKHLDRVRALAKLNFKAKVVSQNNFPAGTGLSSSASGFAALTLAASTAVGLHLSEKALSILARQGSGSACRSVPDGFVEWLNGDTSETSYAVSLYPPNYWRLADVVVIVSEEKKTVSSTAGQKLVGTSPFFPSRLSRIKAKLKLAKKLLAEKNFPVFGELCEAEALELHAVMFTSQPALIYWTPGTLKIMKLTQKWRELDLSVYFTINTGQDIHLICERKTVKPLINRLKKISEVKKIVVNQPAKGARLIGKHLF